MDDDKKLALIKEEYFVLLKFYEDFDARLLTIKGWSITVGVAGIAIGVQYGKPLLFLFSAFATLLFWLLEATWKGLQHAYGPRIKEIEDAYRLGNWDNLVPLQAHSEWRKGWKNSLTMLRRNFFRPIVILPHAFIAVAGTVLWIYSPVVATAVGAK